MILNIILRLVKLSINIRERCGDEEDTIVFLINKILKNNYQYIAKDLKESKELKHQDIQLVFDLLSTNWSKIL